VSLATVVLCNGAEFSKVRDLPALKMGATDLDGILMETNAFIRVANGSEDSGWDIVKVAIDNQDIEIPHLSQASSVAFPNEVFRFSYTYQQTSKPISSVTIDLGDSLRRVSVNGESADKVEALSKLLEKDFRRYTKPVGGVKFRRVTGVCLSMLFLTSLMISATYYWKNRNRSTLGILICSAVGFFLVLLVPWNRFVPGFVLYQRYSPFFLIRHAPEIFLLCLVAALLGIPLSYFLLREKR
jgi:lipopolysaccharide export LptBFGC system permease protein LptF